MNKSLKLAVVGSDYIGKTNLCLALSKRTLEKEYVRTIGVDYIVGNIPETDIKIGMWDLSGLPRFENITRLYVSSSHLILFCYSSEDEKTFNYIKKLYKSYLYDGILEDKDIVIAVTKIDSLDKIQNNIDNGKEFADQINCPFICTSAYNKKGLVEIFNLCSTYLETNNSKMIEVEEDIKPCFIC